MLCVHVCVILHLISSRIACSIASSPFFSHCCCCWHCQILAMVGLVCKNVQLDGKTENYEQNLTHFSVVRKLNDQPFPFNFESVLHRKKPR